MSNGPSPAADLPQDDATGPVHRPTSRLRRSWTERILLTVGVMATTFSLATAAVLAYGLEQFESIATVQIASVEKAVAGEPSNWLLVGTDSRDGISADDPNSGVFIGGDSSQLPTGKRTDTMIVARVDPASERIDLLSIPRDLYVPIAGTGGEARINTAFNTESGEQRLVETIEAYFGFDINHYAEVNFVGFQAIVDELGGVPMWFDKPLRDTNSGLDIQNAGCRSLTGFEALAFPRSRQLEFFENGSWQGDPTGDLGRTSRQQYFLRRVVDTAAAQVDVTSLGKINSLLSVGGSNLTIDEAVEPGDLVGLGKTFADAGGEQIVGHSLPVFDFRTPDGAAVLGLVDDEAQPVLDIFRGLAAPQPVEGGAPAPVPVVLKTSVLNASGVGGQASSVSAALEAEGFEIVEVGNATARTDTLVRYPPDQAAGAGVLVSLLAVDPLVEVDAGVSSVVLITGSDFAGLADSPGLWWRSPELKPRQCRRPRLPPRHRRRPSRRRSVSSPKPAQREPPAAEFGAWVTRCSACVASGAQADSDGVQTAGRFGEGLAATG